MSFDLVIRGATLYDGSGEAPREGDLAVEAGRIAEIGSVGARGDEEIDGSGLALAPGFIDPHTHLDANLHWDPDLTPSSSYGVTTVVMGNCGYALAPIDASTHDYVVDAMVTVEQIPREPIETTVPFDWSDLESYFTRLAALPCLLNHAMLVGHVPVRAAVLGPEDVHRRVATPQEVKQMAAIVRRGLELGALGFSTDQVFGNFGPNGTVLPGEVCDYAELLGIAAVLHDGPGPGVFAMAQRSMLLERADREADLAWHERLAETSGRPVVVGPVFDDYRDSGVGFDLMEQILERRRPDVTVVPQVSTRSFDLWTRLDEPGLFVEAFPTLARAMREGRAALERLAHDPSARARLRDEADHVKPTLVFSGRWEHVFVRHTDPERAQLIGPSVAALAAERGCHPMDLLLDTAVADGFETQVAFTMRNHDEHEMGRMLAHPAAMIGASDAGAHILMDTDSCYAVWTLQHWVRERGLLSLERAIQMLSADQAALFNLTDRGRLAPGLAADLVLFDPDRVATTGVRYVADQPCDGHRLITDATGVALTVVNGVVATRDGKSTGARSGRLLGPATPKTR